MILAAGPGTRLKPLTDSKPKPLIEIQGVPLIEHQIRWLKKAGIQEVVINAHHLAEQFIEHLGTGSRFGVHITLSRENKLLNTGGGIVNALPHLGHCPFVLLNGDIWTNYPFKQLTTYRVTHAHLVLIPTPEHSNRDFALEAGYVHRFQDKEMARHDLTYCGIAVIHPRVFEQCKVEPFSLTRDLIFDLIGQQKVTGEIFSGDWVDIGTPRGLAIAQQSTTQFPHQNR